MIFQSTHDCPQLYEQFGECAIIIIRGTPVWIYPLRQMIDAFEDDPNIEIEEGRRRIANMATRQE